MILTCQNNKLTYLQSSLLTKNGSVQHAFSTRLGGISGGNCSSLNMAFYTEDSSDNVIENRRLFFNIFNIDHEKIVALNQVHGTEIVEVDRDKCGEGALPGSAPLDADALITTRSGLTLCAYSADCLLIYYVAIDTPLVAIAHAGCRGTLGSMAEKVVSRIRSRYGVKPGRLLTYLAPTICKNCYTIDSSLAAKFSDVGWSGSAYCEQIDGDLWKLNLSEINRAQLIRAGINKENIDQSSLCTSCRSDLFYSYRRDRGKTGRMIGFIGITAGRREKCLEQ
jgi:polyphenol oxidase